jgi:hypothetical protein
MDGCLRYLQRRLVVRRLCAPDHAAHPGRSHFSWERNNPRTWPWSILPDQTSLSEGYGLTGGDWEEGQTNKESTRMTGSLGLELPTRRGGR